LTGTRIFMHTLQSYEYVNPTNIIATTFSRQPYRGRSSRRISLLSGVTAI
jgi:hypothetical protein